MSGYESFADFYDILMSDVDYSARTEYLLNLFKKHGKVPSLLLDVACGTGAFSNLMAQKGIEVIGVDASEEMLAVARENSAEMGTQVLYLCQKAEELDLYGTVDGAICCLDSINHIVDLKTLKTAFQKISLFMESGSLFIFDVNTPYKHTDILADNTFVIEEEDIFCVW
ncbi:MAG: class I SAM-dependent methyltransferase [Clostridia bacterium]|nr:class I SAM-dependent methyltransferase [Clostridia bacterium]